MRSPSPSQLPPLPFAPDEIDGFLSRPTAGAIAAVARMTSPVVVLGAAGKMGFHLCLMLRKAADALAKDLKVIAVSRFRTLHDRDSFAAAGIETLACDLSIAEDVARLPDAGTVFFLAGVKFGTSSSPELLERMNVTVPQLVANRYRGAQVVAFSTGCVYPFMTPESGGATEATPPQPVGAYAESCLRREQAFGEVSRRLGARVALIRLNYSVEFRYGVLVDIATSVLESRPIDVTMGFVNVIWQTDALAHVIQAHDLAATPAVPVNVTGDRAYAVRDLAHRFGELLGREPVLTGQESPTAWLSNASWSHRTFGAPATDVGTMQQWIAAWLARGGSTWGKPTHFESRDGKF